MCTTHTAGILESLLKMIYGVDSLIMMVNKKTRFPAQAILAMATFLKTFHHALDNVDANLKELPVLRPAKANAQGSATSPSASNAAALGPFVLPNRQVSFARVQKCCALRARASWRPRDTRPATRRR